MRWYHAKKEELPECSVATTVQLIGNKWKLLILRNLRMRPWRFNELQKSLDGTSQKVFTQSLRFMEADGLIIRTVYAEVPPRVEYSLSELGETTMRPILDAMEQWGNQYKAMFHWKEKRLVFLDNKKIHRKMVGLASGLWMINHIIFLWIWFRILCYISFHLKS